MTDNIPSSSKGKTGKKTVIKDVEIIIGKLWPVIWVKDEYI